MVATYYSFHNDGRIKTKYGFDLEYTAQVYTYVFKHHGGHKNAFAPAKQVASAIRSPLLTALGSAAGAGDLDPHSLKPDVASTALNAAVMAFGSLYYDFNLWWQEQTTGAVWANPYSPVSDTEAYVTYFLWSLKKSGQGIYWTNSANYPVTLGIDYFSTLDDEGIYSNPELQAFP